jgi:hypothetical protein
MCDYPRCFHRFEKGIVCISGECGSCHGKDREGYYKREFSGDTTYVIAFFMALLSFRGISTPSLPAQGEQRRSSYFNILRGDSTLVLGNS